MPKPPPFKDKPRAKEFASPEELFGALSRDKSHAYLRGEQQDVLREYARAADVKDVALELPTGTGKTCVGLLIAEWRRRRGERTAYLSLTNQLAGQALKEAAALGIHVADLRGDQYSRSRTEETKFKTGKVVGVSTYANLFNINPVISECGALILDDAHGGAQKAADMWTIQVTKQSDPGKYSELQTALRTAMSSSQLSEVTAGQDFEQVQLLDVLGHRDCLPAVREALESYAAAKFAWKLLAPKLRECLFLVSAYEIVIRPLIPPTFTHKPFSDASQRIYMSATLGSEADLQRACGIKALRTIRAARPQWGRRYIFVPGLVGDEQLETKIVAGIWAKLEPRRALVIAPSRQSADATFDALSASCVPPPKRLGPADVENDLAPFTEATDIMLVLAGRYDGIDLPEDDCRLLILAGNPAATNALERHLISKWKMGPAMRRREITRLVQGMGRCTRGATDFAVVLWLGPALAKKATSPAAAGLPTEIRQELEWGIEQQGEGEKGAVKLAEMVTELLGDQEYRTRANENLDTIQPSATGADQSEAPAGADDEVRFTEALWEGDYPRAMQLGARIADAAGSDDAARAWWRYMASTAANLADSATAELDHLRSSHATGINTGFTSAVISNRRAPVSSGAAPEEAERVWELIDRWGWRGKKFEDRLEETLQWIGSDEPTDFHRGLERLGELLGARAERSTGSGCPDCVWYFGDRFVACWEAKTLKGPSAKISKRDLQEAKGHPEWVRHSHPELATAEFCVVIVSPCSALHPDAEAFKTGVHHLPPQDLRSLAQRGAETLRSLRAKYIGREFALCHREFAADLVAAHLDSKSVAALLKQSPLEAKQ